MLKISTFYVSDSENCYSATVPGIQSVHPGAVTGAEDDTDTHVTVCNKQTKYGDKY